MPTELLSIRSALRRPRRSAAFTLTELLIVMAVIVLALTLAVPAIRALTGNKSEQAAQNTLSAFLAQARSEAIGLQTVRGVMFYIDPANDRVTCVQVTDAGNAGQPLDRTTTPVPVYLDLAPNHDPMVLPAGLRLFTIKEKFPTPVQPPLPAGMNDRYLGFDVVSMPQGSGTLRVGGVILFDPEGRTVSRFYGFRLMSPGPVLSEMGRLLGFQAPPTTDWPPTSLSQIVYKSQLAFVIVDRDDLTSKKSPTTGANYTDGHEPAAATQSDKESLYLDANATPMFVNRYNGTLTRAE